MASYGYVISLLLLSICAATILDFVQGQTGFISLDCGKPADYSGTDGVTGLTYTSDAAYVEAGDVHTVTSTSEYSHSSNLRSFPTGNRNCYTISSIEKGRLHLVRTFFFYGNYDGKNSLPTFDLYLDVDLWDTIKIPNDESVYHHSEILVTANSGTMSLCLVNTGKGTPFVSAIDVRPLISLDSIYTQVNSSRSLVTRYRLNFGGNGDIRFNDDPYDRFWQPYNKPQWSKKSTPESVESSNDYIPAVVVMKTAATPTEGRALDFYLALSTTTPNPQYYVFMHFAELEQLPPNETRVVDIYRDNKEWFFNLTLKYLSLITIDQNSPWSLDNLNMSIRMADNSIHPPLFNAMEVYEVKKHTGVATNNDDVGAIMEVKRQYKVKKNWNGDPCLPKDLRWDGLNCSYDDPQPSRIVDLTLASSGLSGRISLSLGKLLELKYLDLSDNKLTGEIPEILGSLQHLKFLNLSWNRLNVSSIPKALEEKKTSGGLTLIIENQHPLIDSPEATESTKKSDKFVIVLAASIGSAIVVVLLVGFLVGWLVKRRRNAQKTQQTGRGTQISHGERPPLTNMSSECKNFTYKDLTKITDNFKKTIGKGGFGTVYYGEIKDSPPVAVKILKKSSPEGPKQFQAEAQLLARIYHKNLVSLVGYCNEKDNLGLIYEYMAEGSLADHLTGETAYALSWKDRLRISIEAAQGFQYLHSGCNPTIVHRDVKTSNILLNHHFEVKIGDFGLSRIFSTDTFSQVQTDVAGTPGYLDPEYCSSGQLNEKSDVYSFGVVLLELITGLPAIVKNDKMSLVEWVKPKIESGDLKELVDQRIKNYNPNSVWKVIEVAKACTKPTSAKRPSMMEVLIMLKECMELESPLGANQSSSHASVQISADVSLEILPMDTSSLYNPHAR